MLAESDRHGCALGASIALTLDWRTIRVLLDISALRLDLVPPTCTLPDLPGTARLAATVADTPAIERALLFGAQQPVMRSAERRVGKEWRSTCRSGWSPYHLKKTNPIEELHHKRKIN